MIAELSRDYEKPVDERELATFEHERAIEVIESLQHSDRIIGDTIGDTIDNLTQSIDALRMIVGKDIQAIINQHSGERVGTLDEKREVARRLGDLFDSLGLRIKCPRTGKGGVLIANHHGKDGRFELHVPARDTRTFSSVTFPHVELMLRNMQEKPRGRSR